MKQIMILTGRYHEPEDIMNDLLGGIYYGEEFEDLCGWT